MRHGSLFSGIGGFDLAATWMGWENVFQCERDPFCRRILNFYWPKTKCYHDVQSFDPTPYRGTIDVLSGGFPCQPFSHAGKRMGTDDDRYLWPEMGRIIAVVRPRWVVGENVPGILSWSEGLVFERVLGDLEAEGYEAWAYVLPAGALGAPHKRDRVWLVAHAYGDERREGGLYPPGPEAATRYAGACRAWNLGNAWEDFTSEGAICDGDDGVSNELDGITFSKWRQNSVKGGGNAIVPQVALQIFRMIEKMEGLGWVS